MFYFWFLQYDYREPVWELIKDSVLLDTLVLIAGCKRCCLVVGACMPRFTVTALPLTSPDLKPVIGSNSEGNPVGHLCRECCTWSGWWWCFFLGLPQPCSRWSHPHPSYYPVLPLPLDPHVPLQHHPPPSRTCKSFTAQQLSCLEFFMGPVVLNRTTTMTKQGPTKKKWRRVKGQLEWERRVER